MEYIKKKSVECYLIERYKELLGKKLCSIFIYGSYSRGDRDKKDLDIVLILKNESDIKKYLGMIRRIYNTTMNKRNPRIFSLIEERITMCSPPYVCTSYSFKKMNFTKIFFTGRLKFWSLFQPRSIMLKNIKRTGKIVYGKNLFKYWRNIRIKKHDIYMLILKETLVVLFSFFLKLLGYTKRFEEYLSDVIKRCALNLYLVKRGRPAPSKQHAILLLKDQLYSIDYTFGLNNVQHFTLFKTILLLLKVYTLFSSSTYFEN